MADVKTVRVTISRLMCGRSCGERGIACYEFGKTNQMTGVSLETMLGEEFPDGSVIEVTARVVKRTRRWKVNPWIAEDRKIAAAYQRRRKGGRR